MNFLRISLSSFVAWLLVVAHSVVLADPAPRGFSAPIESTDEYRHFLVKLPAPRGLIVDRNGAPLAFDRVVERIAVRLTAFETPGAAEAPVDQVLDALKEMNQVSPWIELPAPADIKKHWQYRPFIPFPVSEALPRGESEDLLATSFADEGKIEVQQFFERSYPGGKPTGHLTGYVGRKLPEQHGPYGRDEYRWPPVVGLTGLEKSMDSELRGEDGLLSLLFDREGREVNREVLKAPVRGKTVVTSLSLEMQKIAYEQIKKSSHNGAFAAIDSETGDVLALATYPSFDASEFIPFVAGNHYLELSSSPEAPLHNRAVTGVYPPGSTFKPIMALAALSRMGISSRTHFTGPPSIWVDGREFKNWNDEHEGSFDVRFALLRSCNTWFYQAGFETGGEAILDATSQFKLTFAPDIPLDAVSAGNAPEKAPSRRGIANLSIGQGELLASPLQMAMAMTPFANTGELANPRLVLQTQDPVTKEIIKEFPPKLEKLRFLTTDIETVREGMWGVVNHPRGTARRARLEKPHVFGKTGTAQWSNEGDERRLAWFTGFADATAPKIAFAALAEGREGESMSGGRNAAPIAGNFLKAVYENPEEHDVFLPKDLLTAAPSIEGPGGSYDSSYTDRGVRSYRIDDRSRYNSDRGVRRTSAPVRQKRRGGFLSRLFGR